MSEIKQPTGGLGLTSILTLIFVVWQAASLHRLELVVGIRASFDLDRASDIYRPGRSDRRDSCRGDEVMTKLEKVILYIVIAGIAVTVLLYAAMVIVLDHFIRMLG